MASAAQISANRANAQKSTGPRTPEGKAVASQNAVTHGFLARATVIPGEDAGEFAAYRDWKLRGLAPAGDEELDMAERIVGLSWRLRRAERLQTEAFETLYEEMATGAPARGTPPECVPEPGLGAAGGTGVGDDRLLGRMLVEDFSHARVLEKLLLYERRIENSLYRSMRELREQKRMRLATAPPEAIGRTSQRASGGTRLSPVIEDHGRDAHATGTPAGVVMNVPAAQRSLCETNPIPGGGVGRGLGGTGAGDDLPRNELRKTNPIWEEVSSWKCEVASEESQALGLSTSDFPFESAAQPHSCKTNPISLGDSSAPAAVRRVA